MSAPKKIRINLDVNQEVNGFLERLSEESGTTKTDVMRRALALLKVAHEEKARSRTMGFVPDERASVLETKIVGVI